MEEYRHDDVEQGIAELPGGACSVQQGEILQPRGFRFGAEVGVHQYQAVDTIGVLTGQWGAPHAAYR
ncbi:hypothetical protein D3C76_1866740 [compost metagenome]